MNKLLIALLVIVNFTNIAEHKKVKTDNVEVIELNSEDEAFEYIGKDKAVAILIYMTGCGHCEHLKPKFNEAAKKDKKHKFIKVEMSKAPTMVKSNKIQGFPTILIFAPNCTEVKETVVGNNIEGIKKALEKHSAKSI